MLGSPDRELASPAPLEKLEKFLPRDSGLLQNLAHCSLWQIAGMNCDYGPPSWIISVLQEVMTAFGADNKKARPLQGGQHLSSRDLR